MTLKSGVTLHIRPYGNCWMKNSNQKLLFVTIMSNRTQDSLIWLITNVHVQDWQNLTCLENGEQWMSFPVKIKSSCHEYIKTHKCQFLLKICLSTNC